jgi:hypothetical protein
MDAPGVPYDPVGTSEATCVDIQVCGAVVLDGDTAQGHCEAVSSFGASCTYTAGGDGAPASCGVAAGVEAMCSTVIDATEADPATCPAADCTFTAMASNGADGRRLLQDGDVNDASWDRGSGSWGSPNEWPDQSAVNNDYACTTNATDRAATDSGTVKITATPENEPDPIASYSSTDAANATCVDKQVCGAVVLDGDTAQGDCEAVSSFGTSCTYTTGGDGAPASCGVAAGVEAMCSTAINATEADPATCPAADCTFTAMASNGADGRRLLQDGYVNDASGSWLDARDNTTEVGVDVTQFDHIFDMHLVHTSGDEYNGTIEDHGNGLFSFSIRVTRAGTYNFTITLGGRPIANAPLFFEVSAGLGYVAEGNTSSNWLDVPPATETAGVAASFGLHAVDRFGNSLGLTVPEYNFILRGYPIDALRPVQSWTLQGKSTIIFDCDGNTMPEGLLLLGNGVCENQLNCAELNLDGGDCACPDNQHTRVTVTIDAVNVADNAVWGLWGVVIDSDTTTDIQQYFNIMEKTGASGILYYTECWPIGDYFMTISNGQPECSDMIVQNRRLLNVTLPDPCGHYALYTERNLVTAGHFYEKVDQALKIVEKPSDVVGSDQITDSRLEELSHNGDNGDDMSGLPIFHQIMWLEHDVHGVSRLEIILTSRTADWDAGNAMGASMHILVYSRILDRWTSGTGEGVPWSNRSIIFNDRQDISAIRLSFEGSKEAMAALVGEINLAVSAVHTDTNFTVSAANLVSVPWDCVDSNDFSVEFGGCSLYQQEQYYCLDMRNVTTNGTVTGTVCYEYRHNFEHCSEDGADYACPNACKSRHTCKTAVVATPRSDHILEEAVDSAVAEITATVAGAYNMSLTLRSQLFQTTAIIIEPAAVEPVACTVEGRRQLAPLVYWLTDTHAEIKNTFRADETSIFAVGARDRFGNRQLEGNTHIAGQATLDTDTARALYVIEDYNATSSIEDFLDGTYHINFNATIAGDYVVQIDALLKPIAGIPFTVTILPANSSAANTIVKRILGQMYEVASTVVGVSIETVDTYGNFRGVGGDHLDVFAVCLGGWSESPILTCKCEAHGGSDGCEAFGNVRLTLKDNQNGIYFASGRLFIAGNYTMDVFLEGEIVPSSRQPVLIFAAESSADKSVVSQGVTGGKMVAGKPVLYEVLDIDMYGNRNLEGAAAVELIISGTMAGSQIESTTTQATTFVGQGRYTIDAMFYSASNASYYSDSNCVDKQVCGAVVPDGDTAQGDCEAVSSFGASCTYTAGSDGAPASCGVAAGVEVMCSTAIDATEADPATCPAADCTFTAMASDVADGNNSAGMATHMLIFNVQNSPILTSFLQVIPAEADATLSVLVYPESNPDVLRAGEPFSFRLFTHDRFRNMRTLGHDFLCARMFLYGCQEQHAGIPECAAEIDYLVPLEDLHIEDFNTGEYLVTGKLSTSGPHTAVVNIGPLGAVPREDQMQMFLEGRGPEYTTEANETQMCETGPQWFDLPTIYVNLLPGHTNAAETTAQGSGLVGGVAGRNISFSIQARDKYRNKQFPEIDESADLNVVLEYRSIDYVDHTTITSMESFIYPETNDTYTQEITRNSSQEFYKYDNAIYVTAFEQRIYGNLTIPDDGGVRSWDDQTLEGRAKMRQFEIGTASVFDMPSKAITILEVLDATDISVAGKLFVPGEIRVQLKYVIEYIWGGGDEKILDKTVPLEDQWIFQNDMYRRINQAGAVITFTLDQIYIHQPHRPIIQTEYSAEVEVTYIEDTAGEYLVRYQLPPLARIEGSELVRISVMYGSQEVAGSPRLAVLLGDVSLLSINASRSEATGLGVDGHFEAGTPVSFIVQMRDDRGIDLVPSEVADADVALSVQSDGLSIELVDLLNGRYEGSYVTNQSDIYEIGLIYTAAGRRDDVLGYIEGEKFYINDEPYKVQIYAARSYPPNSQAVTITRIETAVAVCDEWLSGNGAGTSEHISVGDSPTREACIAKVASEHPSADGVTYSDSNCSCVFPFVYSGVTYIKCISLDADEPWCATEVDANLTYVKYANCAQVCAAGSKRQDCFAEFGWSGATEETTPYQTCRIMQNLATATTTTLLQQQEKTVAGKAFVFNLVSKDSHQNMQNNPAYSTRDEYSVVVTSVDGSFAPTTLSRDALGDGMYSVSLTAQKTGSYNVSITLQDSPIANPHFILIVETNKISPASSLPAGFGIELTSVAATAKFSILLRDSFGNVAPCSEEALATLTLEGLQVSYFYAVCDKSMIRVVYNTTVAGIFKVNVTAGAGSTSVDVGQYGGRAYTITIEPAPVAADTSEVIFTHANATSITPGSTLVLKLDLRDRFGNPTELRTSHNGEDLSAGLQIEWSHNSSRDGDSFDIVDVRDCVNYACVGTTTSSLREILEGQSPIYSGLTSVITPGGKRDADGYFVVTYSPVAYGPYTFGAVTNGEHLRGSPDHVFVKRGDAPRAQYAAWGGAALDLEIIFDIATNRARMGSYVWPCDTILQEIMHPNGRKIKDPMPADLSCRWRTSKVLLIDLTSKSTSQELLTKDNIIHIKPKVLQSGENSPAVVTAAVVQNPTDVVKTHANLAAPSIVPTCESGSKRLSDALTLNAAGSKGAAGRPFTFEWGVFAWYPQVLNAVVVNGSNITFLTTSEIETLPQVAMQAITEDADSPFFAGATDATLYIPGGLLTAGVAYNISVVVTNEFGASSSDYALITVVDNKSPSVTLPSSGQYAVNPGQDLYLDAAVRTASCLIGDKVVVWHWQLFTGATLVKQMTKNVGNMFVIPGDLLGSGQTYQLMVTAQMAGSPSLIGYDTAVIRVKSAGVHADIKFDGPNSVKSNRVLVLDASGSYDKDDPTNIFALRYSWKMQKYGFAYGVLCDNTDETYVISLLRSIDPILTIRAGLLLPDQQCQLTVTATRLEDSEATSASYVLAILNALVSPPDVRLSRLVPAEDTITVTVDNVVLEGLLLSPKPTLDVNVATACAYSLAEGILASGTAVSEYERHINSGVSRLILPTGSLVEGQLYHIRFACFVDGHEGFAEHIFETNRPPMLGKLSGRQYDLESPVPLTIDGSLMEIDLITEGWADDLDDDPFVYMFTAHRECHSLRLDCVDGHTSPIVLGSSLSSIRTAVVHVTDSVNLTFSVTATDRHSATSSPVAHTVAIISTAGFQSPAEHALAAENIITTKMSDALAAGDISMTMQLMSVVAESLRHSISARRVLMTGRRLESGHDNALNLKLQTLEMVTVATQSMQAASEDALFQYLTALADLTWVPTTSVSNPGSDFSFENLGFQFLAAILDHAGGHSRLQQHSANAAMRAIDGILHGLPPRLSDFGQGQTMAMAQMHYNRDSSFAGDYTMVPNFAIKNCEQDTWSVNYEWTRLSDLSTGTAFSEIEFAQEIQRYPPPPCPDLIAECLPSDYDAGQYIGVTPECSATKVVGCCCGLPPDPTYTWTVVRMGGAVSGSYQTCGGEEVLSAASACANTLSRALLLDAVCGQDPTLLTGTNFAHISRKICMYSPDPVDFSTSLRGIEHSLSAPQSLQLESKFTTSSQQATAQVPDEVITQTSAIWSDPQLWVPAGDFITPVIHFAAIVDSARTSVSHLQFSVSLLREFTAQDHITPQCSSLMKNHDGVGWSGTGCEVLLANNESVSCICTWDNTTATSEQFAVLAAPSQCQLWDNCFDCLKSLECGWCGASNSCFEGNAGLAFYPAECTADWSWNSCPCETFSTCASCLGPAGVDAGTGRYKRSCGFCPRLDACMEASEQTICGTKLMPKWPTGIEWINMNTTCPVACDSVWGSQHGYIMNECGDLHGSCVNYTTCECQAGRFRSDCSGECPGGVDNICSSRGECGDGAKGNGKCSCTAGNGYGGRDCRDCDLAHWGADCNQTCPGVVANQYPSWHPLFAEAPCNRQGSCDSGESGSGVCWCDYGYWNTSCQVEAPGGAANPCSKKGELVQDIFLVERSAAVHHASAIGECECAGGYWDLDCSKQCAGEADLSGAGLCLGRGFCDDGNTGDGRCWCLAGYRGAYCQDEPMRVLVQMHVELPSDSRLLLDSVARTLQIPMENLELLSLVPETEDLSDSRQVAVFEIYSSSALPASDIYPAGFPLGVRATSVWSKLQTSFELGELNQKEIGYSIRSLSNRTFVRGELQSCPEETCNGGGDCEKTTGVCYCYSAYTGLTCAISLAVKQPEIADLTGVWVGIAAALGGFLLAVAALIAYIWNRRRKMMRLYEAERKARRRRASQRSDSQRSDSGSEKDLKSAGKKRFRSVTSLSSSRPSHTAGSPPPRRPAPHTLTHTAPLAPPHTQCRHCATLLTRSVVRRLSAIFGGSGATEFAPVRRQSRRGSEGGRRSSGRRGSVRGSRGRSSGRDSSGGSSGEGSGTRRTDAWVEQLVKTRVNSQLKKAGVLPGQDGVKGKPQTYKLMQGPSGAVCRWTRLADTAHTHELPKLSAGCHSDLSGVPFRAAGCGSSRRRRRDDPRSGVPRAAATADGRQPRTCHWQGSEGAAGAAARRHAGGDHVEQVYL